MALLFAATVAACSTGDEELTTTHPCDNIGTYTNEQNGDSCACAAGFTGAPPRANGGSRANGIGSHNVQLADRLWRIQVRAAQSR